MRHVDERPVTFERRRIFPYRRHLMLFCEGSMNVFPFDQPACTFSMESSEYKRNAHVQYFLATVCESSMSETTTMNSDKREQRNEIRFRQTSDSLRLRAQRYVHVKQLYFARSEIATIARGVIINAFVLALR